MRQARAKNFLFVWCSIFIHIYYRMGSLFVRIEIVVFFFLNFFLKAVRKHMRMRSVFHFIPVGINILTEKRANNFTSYKNVYSNCIECGACRNKVREWSCKKCWIVFLALNPINLMRLFHANKYSFSFFCGWHFILMNAEFQKWLMQGERGKSEASQRAQRTVVSIRFFLIRRSNIIKITLIEWIRMRMKIVLCRWIEVKTGGAVNSWKTKNERWNV